MIPHRWTHVHTVCTQQDVGVITMCTPNRWLFWGRNWKKAEVRFFTMPMIDLKRGGTRVEGIHIKTQDQFDGVIQATSHAEVVAHLRAYGLL